jgi:four helix bundle protein
LKQWVRSRGSKISKPGKGPDNWCKRFTKSVPFGDFAKDFGLKEQIRRAAVSVMSNIAEGFERGGDKEFLQFLALAKASGGEVRSQLYVALDRNYLNEAQFRSISETAIQISQLIAGFMRYLQQSDLRGSKYLRKSS